MTSTIPANGTSNEVYVDDYKEVDEVHPDVRAKSGKGNGDNLPDREIVIRADAAIDLQVRYDVQYERIRILNRLYNLGVPETETTTDF
ncbi:MAG: hypothetical protein KF886_04405 [Candidatus Hydrogenedentes bacterium]|nr:hypothetical protein [Candidatus Hydrogenedentota bacterium]